MIGPEDNPQVKIGPVPKRAQPDSDYLERERVRAKARRAVKSGKIEKGPCIFAHEGECYGRIEMHHDDYDKPLEVTWVCTGHHVRLDVERWGPQTRQASSKSKGL